MTECPECGVPVRVDRLEKHRKRVHRSRETLPKNRLGANSVTWSRPTQEVPFTNKGGRITWRKCPYCQEFFRLSEIQRHLSSCPDKAKGSSSSRVQGRAEMRKTQANDRISDREHPPRVRDTPKPPVVPKTYIIDEYGVVQDYTAWWENQNLAENTLDARPVQAMDSGRIFNQGSHRSKSQYTHCPECGVRLNAKKLKRHLRKVHQK
jgi:hypothetical protein